MNPFLTEKALRKTSIFFYMFLGCLLVFGIVSVFFGIAGGFLAGNREGGIMAVVVGALLACPLLIVHLKDRDRAEAVRIAEVLKEMRSGTVSFEQLSEKAGISQPGDTVLRFLRMGCLQNIQVDFENQEFILFTPKAKMRWGSGKKGSVSKGDVS